jgi:uncharacterized protein with HEPN domain
MNEKILKYLYDIQLSITEIDSFFENGEKKYGVYKNSTLIKRAIERDMEIIGEAMGRILKEDTDFNITNAKRIVGLRNQIIHGYDSISDENIWAIVINHLPKLKIEVDTLINKAEFNL